MICNLYGPNVTIVFGNDVIMTSFVTVELSNLRILQNTIYAISPVSFKFLECLDLILQGGGSGKNPQCCTRRKKPSAFRAN